MFDTRKVDVSRSENGGDDHGRVGNPERDSGDDHGYTAGGDDERCVNEKDQCGDDAGGEYDDEPHAKVLVLKWSQDSQRSKEQERVG